jgi:AcrR family transcriptional regulator
MAREKDGERNGAGNATGRGRAAPKGGRDAVVARVLDAAEELFSAHPYADVSVREIADAAGVSHALVHRYVGAKADILRAVLARHEGMFTEAAAGAGTVRDAVALMLGGDMDLAQRYFRLVARVSLDSVLREVADVDFAATRLLAALAAAQVAAAGEDPPVDPRLAVAAVVSLVVGFGALKDVLLREVGIEDMDPRVLDEQMGRIVDATLIATIPEPRGSR